jgi:hypothetical protein
MNYLAFKIYLIKCLSVSNNGDIRVLNNWLIILLKFHIKYIYIYIYIYIYECIMEYSRLVVNIL